MNPLLHSNDVHILFCFAIFEWLAPKVSSQYHLPTKCPEKVLWRARAKDTCLNETYYHCLVDGSLGTHVEKCIAPKRYPKGFRSVFNRNLDAEKCSHDRFSPHHIMSNEGFVCSHVKHQCNEEGQLSVDDGNSSADRSCRCDYTRGFDYISRPNNPCECLPQAEDCSCYIKACIDNHVLSIDYKCKRKELVRWDDTSACKPLINDRLKTNNITIDNYKGKEISKKDVNQGRFLFLSFVTAASGLLITISAFTCVYFGQNICRNSKTTAVKGIMYDEILKNSNKSLEESCSQKSDILSENIQEPAVEHISYQEIDMIVVPYYQRTKHVDEIKQLFKKGSRLVFLTGPPGAGKTQTANRFCTEEQRAYSLVFKLVATDRASMLHSLMLLLKGLSVSANTDENENILIKSNIQCLKRYLLERKTNYSYLMVIDDVHLLNDYLMDVLSLLGQVENLKILLTTYDSTLKNSYPTVSVVEHKGMEESEYIHFFKQTEHFKNSSDEDIKNIVAKIGTLPLALNCARDYIAITKTSIEAYLVHFKTTDDDKLEKMISHENPFYKYGLLQSQRIPLEEIKKQINSKLWDVMMLFPLMQYASLSLVVIEACHRHWLKGLKPTSDVGDIITMCSKYSLCIFQEKHTDKLCVGSNKIQNNILSFHTATILALKWIDLHNNDQHETKRERLFFLLVVFCYEIDTDPRDSSTLDRNLLFLDHAMHVLSKFDQSSSSQSDEEKIYIIYVHFAIGKTLLLEGARLTLAHIYLMKSRSLCIAFAGERSAFTIKNCIYTQERLIEAVQSLAPDQVETEVKAISATNVDVALAETFVLSKRRNKYEQNLLRECGTCKNICKKCYLINSDYELLKKKQLVLTPKMFSQRFLRELMLRISYNNCKALSYLKYQTQVSDQVEEAINCELIFCNKLFKTINSDFKDFPSIPYIRHDVCVKSMIRRSSDNQVAILTTDEIDTYIQSMEDSLKIDEPLLYFNLGVVNASSKSIDHECMCYKFILQCLKHKYKCSTTIQTQAQILQKGSEVIGKLLHLLDRINDGWLEIPKLYIQCAKFHQLSADEDSWKISLSLFRKAIEFENNRHAELIPCLWKSYVGEVQCLRKLNKKDEVRDIYERLMKQFQGTSKAILQIKLTKEEVEN